MKPNSIVYLIILGVCMTNSCTTLKRYDSMQQSGTDNTLAGIDLFGFRLSKAKPENGNKTLWDLSADAQSQFIKILNTRYPDNDNFLNALSFEYLKEDPANLPDDYVKKDLRMIFSISKRRDFGRQYNPPGIILSAADRIEYLKISLKIDDESGVRFTGWNMFTSEYGSINIASVSFSRSIEIDPSGLLSVDKKLTGGELSTGAKSSSNRREDQDIQYRYLKLNGRINNNEIEMEEEGTREIDLTGNIAADVSLEFEGFPEMVTEITGLKDSTGAFSAPEKLSVLRKDAIIPGMENIKDTIFAELSMDYVFRNVLKGQNTFPEWDDRVKYIKGRVTKSIALFTSDDYVPHFYSIGTNSGSAYRDVIKMTGQDSKEYAMIFTTRNEAGSFYEWLADYFKKAGSRGKPLKIGGNSLKFRGGELTKEIFLASPDLRIIPSYHSVLQ